MATGCSASNEEPVGIHTAQELSGRIPLHLNPQERGIAKGSLPRCSTLPQNPTRDGSRGRLLDTHRGQGLNIGLRYRKGLSLDMSVD